MRPKSEKTYKYLMPNDHENMIFSFIYINAIIYSYMVYCVIEHITIWAK